MMTVGYHDVLMMMTNGDLPSPMYSYWENGRNFCLYSDLYSLVAFSYFYLYSKFLFVFVLRLVLLGVLKCVSIFVLVFSSIVKRKCNIGD